MNRLYGFGEMLIRCAFPFLILFSGSVLATTSGFTGPVFGRQITINDPVEIDGSLLFTSTAPAVTDPDGESVDHWLYQWKVDGVAVGAEVATTKADFSEITYRARAVDFNKKLQLCVKAVSPTGCYPDQTCRSESVCSVEADISTPVVKSIAVNVTNGINNALADGVSINRVEISVTDAAERNVAAGYPVTLTASNGAIVSNSITTNSMGLAYPEIKSYTPGESVITATTGYGLSKQVTVNFEADYELHVTGIIIPQSGNNAPGWIYNGAVAGVEVAISLTKGGNAVQGESIEVPCSSDDDFYIQPCGWLTTDVSGVIKYRSFDIWDGPVGDVYSHSYRSPDGRVFSATYSVP